MAFGSSLCVLFYNCFHPRLGTPRASHAGTSPATFVPTAQPDLGQGSQPGCRPHTRPAKGPGLAPAQLGRQHLLWMEPTGLHGPDHPTKKQHKTKGPNLPGVQDSKVWRVCPEGGALPRDPSKEE